METNYYYNITLLAPRLIGEPALHHYVSTDSYDIIRSDIAEACAQLGIEKINKAPSGYKCSSFKDQHMIEFTIDIYSDRERHVIEFRQMSGDDRFAFAELLHDIQEQLKCNIVGSRNFPRFDEIDLSNQDQMYDFLKELMDSNAPDWQKDALQTLAACSRQIREHNVQCVSERFVSSTSQVVLKALDKALNTRDNYLFLVSALADYFSIPTRFDADILEKAKQLTLSQPLESLGYHERRETVRLALSLKEHYTYAELDHFDTSLDSDRILNRYLIKLLAE